MSYRKYIFSIWHIFFPFFPKTPAHYPRIFLNGFWLSKCINSTYKLSSVWSRTCVVFLPTFSYPEIQENKSQIFHKATNVFYGWLNQRKVDNHNKRFILSKSKIYEHCNRASKKENSINTKISHNSFLVLESRV